MTHSCCDSTCDTEKNADVCDRCGARGHTVPREALESLLTPTALKRLQPGSYLFDASPDCDIVYFSKDSDSYFTKRDLRVRVGIKESEPPIPICYCFRHTLESARAEIQVTGRSTVAAEITKEIRARRCACEVKNPSGRCCLGEVNKAVKTLLSVMFPANSECPIATAGME